MRWRSVSLFQIKILLLGAGESGKSTFLKQMRLIHGIGFNHDLLLQYQHVIYSNIVQGNAPTFYS